MKHPHLAAPLLVLALSALGCGTPAAPDAARTITVVGALDWATGYQVQSTVRAWLRSDVHCVELSLQEADGTDLGVHQTLTDLSSPVALAGLGLGHAYRLKAEAFTADGTNITAAGGTLTSFTTPGLQPGGTVETTMTIAGGIGVRLADRPFSGSADASGVSVVDGGFLVPAETPAMQSVRFGSSNVSFSNHAQDKSKRVLKVGNVNAQPLTLYVFVSNAYQGTFSVAAQSDGTYAVPEKSSITVSTATITQSNQLKPAGLAVTAASGNNP